MKEKHPRSLLATCSLIASLLGPVLAVLGIMCLMFVWSLPRAAIQNIVIPSLFLPPSLALLLGITALAKIRRSESAIRGRGLARGAIAISVLTLCFLVWAVPACVRARATSRMNACTGGNLRQIDAAKEMWVCASRITNGPVDITGISEYIKEGMPVCPEGGEYTVGNIGELPRCSLHGTTEDRYYPKWWE